MKNTYFSKYYRQILVILAVLGSALVVVPAFAQTTSTAPASGTGSSSGYHGGFGRGGQGGMGGGMGHMSMPPGVFGTVSAVNGTTLTVTSKIWQRPASGSGTTTPTTTATTYTVDASNATVTKSGASSSVSDIAVGDMVMIQGTVSGTSVTATKINDGIVPRPMGQMGGKPGQNGQTGTAPVTIPGNGEPVVAGSVTAVSGSTLTITNKSNVTYTVDASSAFVEKGNATSTVASVATGDNVVVQGTVNGNSVTASSVIDQGATPTSTSTVKGPMGGARGGFFGAIGSFFAHIFGF